MVSGQSKIDARKVADCVEQFRKRRAHIHCITNSVAQTFTANILLAAGATPSMTINPDEVADFVAMSDGLLINLGTMERERSTATGLAVAKAQSFSKPWALDPVFVQASKTRLRQAETLIIKQPSLIRCNAAEARALFGGYPDPDEISAKAIELKTCIALTGPSDIICGDGRSIGISNGSPLMDRVTAMGCALTAVMLGFLVLEEEPALCAASAAVFFGLAGEVAERRSTGPGSFVPAFLDALHALSREEIEAGARFS